MSWGFYYLQVRDKFGRLGPFCNGDGTVRTFSTEEEALHLAEMVGEDWVSYRVAKLGGQG